jgi:hypothetical protein
MAWKMHRKKLLHVSHLTGDNDTVVVVRVDREVVVVEVNLEINLQSYGIGGHEKRCGVRIELEAGITVCWGNI